jgi:hypothetical protein
MLNYKKLPLYALVAYNFLGFLSATAMEEKTTIDTKLRSTKDFRIEKEPRRSIVRKTRPTPQQNQSNEQLQRNPITATIGESPKSTRVFIRREHTLMRKEPSPQQKKLFESLNFTRENKKQVLEIPLELIKIEVPPLKFIPMKLNLCETRIFFEHLIVNKEFNIRLVYPEITEGWITEHTVTVRVPSNSSLSYFDGLVKDATDNLFKECAVTEYFDYARINYYANQWDYLSKTVQQHNTGNFSLPESVRINLNEDLYKELYYSHYDRKTIPKWTHLGFQMSFDFFEHRSPFLTKIYDYNYTISYTQIQSVLIDSWSKSKQLEIKLSPPDIIFKRNYIDKH